MRELPFYTNWSLRASPRDRARGRGCVARARRSQPRLLRLRRLRGGRVGVEARAPVLRGARQSAWSGGRAHGRRRSDARRRGARCPARLGQALAAGVAHSPTTARRWERSRSTASLRCATPFEPLVPEVAARAEHEPLPPPGRGDARRSSRRSCSWTISSTRSRPAGRRDRRDGDHGAGAERRRVLHAAGGLLARRARDLRPVRHPALRRRGDHRLRPPRRVVRLRAVRHPAGHHDDRQGSLVLVRGDRRGGRLRAT